MDDLFEPFPSAVLRHIGNERQQHQHARRDDKRHGRQDRFLFAQTEKCDKKERNAQNEQKDTRIPTRRIFEQNGDAVRPAGGKFIGSRKNINRKRPKKPRKQNRQNRSEQQILEGKLLFRFYGLFRRLLGGSLRGSPLGSRYVPVSIHGFFFQIFSISRLLHDSLRNVFIILS